jgi:hypothetical protein
MEYLGFISCGLKPLPIIPNSEKENKEIQRKQDIRQRDARFIFLFASLSKDI